ncbi:hypothetical protein BBP40_004198 [Aspergillus hancockii]|nr:hypothetical protein BBP40_004198 [Aspergillus hancockii]
MRFTACSLLFAASTALASPALINRSSSLKITELRASTSQDNSANMHFVLTDPNYTNDTPVECNLIWPYGSNPDQNARCNNGQYYIRFPNGAREISHFTLELERVSSETPVKGQALLDGGALGTKWICQQDPIPGVIERCSYEGTLDILV